MSKATLIATLMAVVSVFSPAAKAQAPLKKKPSAKSDQPTYMITAHTVVPDDSGIVTIQRNNYVIVHGSEVLRVQYDSSLNCSSCDAPGMHGWFDTEGPDLSQVPQVGVPIRACEMEAAHPGLLMARPQSVSAPCMVRYLSSNWLIFVLAPNGGIKMDDYVEFEILGETNNVGVVAAPPAHPSAQSASSNDPYADIAVPVQSGSAATATSRPNMNPPRKDIPAIAKAANGAIVSIITSDKDGKPVAQGTGFLVSKDGRIVTNYHVIKDASSAIVKLPDGAFYDVDGVVAFDKARDLAVIKAHGQNFRVATLGNSDRVQVGEEIVAIGSPLSLESTVSNGIVSGIRTVEKEGGKYLQITAPISPGSSGGPLFNMAGEVVGITTLYLEGGENLNFAIPINDAKRLLSASSKVQDFPVETEAAKSEAHAEAAPSASANPITPRDYYKQLYDAGGILDSFVCFHDDPSLQWFFTFTIDAYDERWDKAFKVVNLWYQASKASKEAPPVTEEDRKALQTKQSIEASRPIVHFMFDEAVSTMDGLGAGTEAYLRRGRPLLEYSVYYKGVMTNSGNFRDTGDLWTFDLSPTLNQTDKIVLTFEPTTLRYVQRVSGTALVSGMCEKIPIKQSN